MKIDRGSVMFPISKAAGHLFNHLDLAVQPLGGSIGDAVLEVGQDIGQVPVQGLCRLHDGRQSRMGRPVIPSPKIAGNSKTSARTP